MIFVLRAAARMKQDCCAIHKNREHVPRFSFPKREKASERELSDDFGTAYSTFLLSAKPWFGDRSLCLNRSSCRILIGQLNLNVCILNSSSLCLSSALLVDLLCRSEDVAGVLLNRSQRCS